MDFPADEVIAQVGAAFRGGNAVFEMGRWTVAGVVHFEWFEYVLFGEVVQTIAADVFEDFAQDEKAHVAVRGVCAGFINQGELAGRVEHGLAGIYLVHIALVFIQMNMCGQATAMGE